LRKLLQELEVAIVSMLDIRGTDFHSEVTYLIDLLLGATLRRLGAKNLLLPGHLIFRDICVKVKHLEDSIFCLPARSDALLFTMPYFEPLTLKLVKSLLKPGDIAIDVGAHIGIYTIFMAKIVGPKGVVVAVEPSPIRKYLVRNIKLNNVKNVLVSGMAAHSTQRHLEFYFNLTYSGIGSTVFDWVKNMKQHVRLEVQADTLDNIVLSKIPSLNRVKLLKVDVEGAEVDVLKGSSRILELTDYIIFEASKQTLRRCLKILSDFDIKPIEKSGPRTFNFIATRRGRD
jgi:FkbM family methyltransferase